MTTALNLTAPTGWDELTQTQLTFLLKIIGDVNRRYAGQRFASAEDFTTQTGTMVAIHCLFSWNDIEVVTPYVSGWLIRACGKEYKVEAEMLAAAAEKLNWINSLPEDPVRLNCIDGAKAAEADLSDSFTFNDWLSCEALWQGYQVTQKEEFLHRMAEILYSKPGIKLMEYEVLSIFYWWVGVKAQMNRLYPHFFQPAVPGTSTEPTQDSVRQSMNAQIRALTKGDITKEDLILSMEAHRALTELDAQAKEYDELNRKYPSK